jgi:hypothetical protein
MDADQDTMRVIIALVNRLGGKVTLTEDELIGLDPGTQLVSHRSNTVQDDLFYLEVKIHGSEHQRIGQGRV